MLIAERLEPVVREALAATSALASAASASHAERDRGHNNRDAHAALVNAQKWHALLRAVPQ
jgi:hypothetical protein